MQKVENLNLSWSYQTKLCAKKNMCCYGGMIDCAHFDYAGRGPKVGLQCQETQTEGKRDKGVVQPSKCQTTNLIFQRQYLQGQCLQVDEGKHWC